MHKSFIVAGGALAGLAVLLGAFGAHGLRDLLNPESLPAYESAARYQMYHALALILTGILYERFRTKWVRYAGYFFAAGVLLFSGSLYLLTLLRVKGETGISGIGLFTPIGGLAFVAGWICLTAGVALARSSTLKPV